MRNDDWLKQATKKLTEAGVGSARLDSLILLEDIACKDRAWLLAHPEFELSEVQIVGLNNKITRRVTHEPLAYIRGHVEFYGREFTVNEHVLVPRPESETMISMLISLELSKPVIIDIGTGSGALAITAQLELPGARVIGTDIDPHCLAVAQYNATRLHASVVFMESDLVSAIIEKPDVIMANLPYVPDEYEINRAAGHEPELALFGGPDGLDLYRQMFRDCLKRQLMPAYMLTEALPEQHSQLETIANESGYALHSTERYIQLFARTIQK